MNSSSHLVVPIRGMTCAACVNRVEKVLNRLPGVSARVNLMTELAHIDLNTQGTTSAQIEGAIRAAGYEVGSPREDPSVTDRKNARAFAIAALLTLPFVFEMIGMAMGAHHLIPPWLQALLAAPMQFWVGARFYRGAWHALRNGAANMDVLVVLGTTAAYGYSLFVLLFGMSSQHYYFEACVFIITFVLLGKLLEARARHQSNNALKDLARLLPRKALLRRDGSLVEVDADQVQEGAEVVVRAHERAPVDGEVIEGESEMDESLITGESVLVPKRPGARVFAGARNEQGQLVCRARRVGSRTHLAEVARLVEMAQASKAPVQQLADRVAAVFVPVMVAISVLTALVWWGMAGAIEPALVNAIAVLVIACPCALGLATPAAVAVGMGRGAHCGILLRDARALQSAGSIDVLAVDKTGTLTQGHPAVTRVFTVPGHDLEAVLRVALSLEGTAVHPLARAIAQYASATGVAAVVPSEVSAFPGHGVRAVVDGDICFLGSKRFMGEQGIPDAIEFDSDPEWRTATQVLIARRGQVIGGIALRDAVRESTPEALSKLHTMGVEVVMLTGDRIEVAAMVARQLGIKHFEAQMLPAEKAQAIRALQQQGKRVGMAGDGVNDSPALAGAEVGFAMGAGADLAVESADVTLMRNDLTGVARAIELSRATLTVIRQNLFFAFVYNLLCIPAAAVGLLNPIIASAAMALSSVMVVANALRLRRWQPMR